MILLVKQHSAMALVKSLVPVGQHGHRLLQKNLAVVAGSRASSHFVYKPDDKAPVEGPTTKMNMFTAINNAMDMAMERDKTALVFGK